MQFNQKILTGFLFTAFLFLFISNSFPQTFQWSTLPGVPPGGRHDDIYFINPDTGWAINYDLIYKTTNGGKNWISVYQPGSNRSIGFFDSEFGIVGTLDTSRPLSRTTNGGINWTLITDFPEPKPAGVCGISIVNESTAYFSGAYYGHGRAYKTVDKGETWSLVFNDTSLAKTLIDCYFWSPDSGIIVGGSGYLNGNSVILLTSNSGKTWQSVYRSNRLNEWCWKISFISRNIGFVSIQRHTGLSYFLKTTNGGFNWTEIPFLNQDQQAIGFINENTGWIGEYSNFCYETTNGGTNWYVVNWGSSLNRIRILNDTLAYASGRQVYKYSRTTVGINPVSTEIPSAFKLYQNYPNPFNPVTKIRFDVSGGNNSAISLIVYNSLGKEISTLVNENLSPGSYEVAFEGNGLSSGLYFYRLTSDNYIEVKKMILIK